MSVKNKMTAEKGLPTQTQHVLRRLTYTAMMLVLFSHYHERIVDFYMSYLARTDQIMLLTRLIGYLVAEELMFVLLLMLGILGWYRLNGVGWSSYYQLGPDVKGTLLARIALGTGVGLILFVLSFPLLLTYNPGLDPAYSVVGNPYSVRTLVLAILLILAVPLSTEVVFRGIIFKTLLKHTTPAAAVIASSVLFAFVWPLFGVVVAFMLGLSNALLYYRSRSLLPPIFANAVLSTSLSIALIWQKLAAAG